MDLKGIDHGLDWNNWYCQVWFIACPVLNILFTILFRTLGWFPGKSRHGTELADVASFLLVAGGCVVYLGCAGVYAYFGAFIDGNTIYDDLAADRMYGYSAFVENHIVYPMLAYQAWNLVASMLMNEFRGIQMIVHHVLTGSLGYFGLYPYLHFQGLFFFGVTEVTNIPLTAVDFFKQFKNYAKAYPGVYSASRTIFGVSFILVRLIWWPIVCYSFWKDSIELYMSGNAHSNFVVLAFLVANILLTGLQFIWGRLIVAAVLGSGEKAASKTSKKKK